MRTLSKLCMVLVVVSCGTSAKQANSIEIIKAAGQQDSIFQNLILVTGNIIPENRKSDSLAFLVLPVQASCPSCRNKTIDSIVKHQNNLLKNHFIVISANGGRKTIGGYFKENNRTIPDGLNSLILDSNNMAYKVELYDKKPVMYYTYNRKAYKKVAAVPATVRDDLQEFFSGFRNGGHEK